MSEETANKTRETAKKTGKSGTHAGDRMLVTLDKDIYKAFASMAELEGLPVATKARQILTMYVNNVALVPRGQVIQPNNFSSTTDTSSDTNNVPNPEDTKDTTDVPDSEKSDFIIDQNKPKVAGLKRPK